MREGPGVVQEMIDICNFAVGLSCQLAIKKAFGSFIAGLPELGTIVCSGWLRVLYFTFTSRRFHPTRLPPLNEAGSQMAQVQIESFRAAHVGENWRNRSG